jgi:molybdenum cofactor biosynthesis enzyme
MSRVQIQGLNSRQRKIADVLWMMQDRTQVEAFVRALDPTMRREAETVVELMMLAIWDEIESIDDSVKVLIDNLK